MNSRPSILVPEKLRRPYLSLLSFLSHTPHNMLRGVLLYVCIMSSRCVVLSICLHLRGSLVTCDVPKTAFLTHVCHSFPQFWNYRICIFRRNIWKFYTEILDRQEPTLLSTLASSQRCAVRISVFFCCLVLSTFLKKERQRISIVDEAYSDATVGAHQEHPKNPSKKITKHKISPSFDLRTTIRVVRHSSLNKKKHSGNKSKEKKTPREIRVHVMKKNFSRRGSRIISNITQPRS